jgi:tetratricopeptide (TPR) repeat protein
MKMVSILIFFILFSCFNSFSLSLSDAQKDYLFGNYQEAIRKAEMLKPTDESLYFLGVAYIKIGEYKLARSSLERLHKYFAHSSFRVQASVKIADSFFLEKDYKKAEKIYKDIKNRHPTFDGMPQVLLRLIQISARDGDWEKKDKYIKIFKDKYPDSSEMIFVKKIEERGDFFTIQIGAFSEKKNALMLKAELSKKYKLHIIEERNGSYPLFKVRIGRYSSRNEVEKVSASLLDEGYPVRIYP